MSEETTAPEEGNQEPGLSYGDIMACVQIIDVTSTRGAIKGDELVQVGTVRERLASRQDRHPVPPVCGHEGPPAQTMGRARKC
mgnify:CR=1 FL=1